MIVEPVFVRIKCKDHSMVFHTLLRYDGRGSDDTSGGFRGNMRDYLLHETQKKLRAAAKPNTTCGVFRLPLESGLNLFRLLLVIIHSLTIDSISPTSLCQIPTLSDDLVMFHSCWRLKKHQIFGAANRNILKHPWRKAYRIRNFLTRP